MKTNAILVALAVVIIAGVIMFIKSESDRTTDDTQGGKMLVVSTIYPVSFFAQEVGGDRALVQQITPAGAEAHDFEPTPRDVAQIEDSRLFIYNGGDVDVWGERVARDLDLEQTRVVVASEGLMTLMMENHHEDEHGDEEEHDDEDEHHDEEEHDDEEEDHASESAHGEEEMIEDPHVWLSPTVAASMVDNIASGFIQADPENETNYTENAVSLKARLSELDQTFSKGLQTCQRNDIITSHAAFGYLSESYNLTQVPIAGISPDQEPSVEDLSDIVDYARDNVVPYIFFESLVSPKLSQTIAQEVGAKTLVLNPLEGLTPEEFERGEDYFSVMEENLQNLRTALSCT